MCWFLALLDEDMRISHNSHAWNFISYNSKGLFLAFDEVFPNVAHRFVWDTCTTTLKLKVIKVKHWRMSYGKLQGQPLKLHFTSTWKKLNTEANQWFINKPHIHCSRGSLLSQCDMLLNNLCESFNNVLFVTRDKHILTMLELIRLYVMSKFQKNRDNIMNHTHKICP